MALRRNDEIKQGIIAKLKASSSVTAELGAATDIKESQWQGTEFDYPAIRVRINSNIPVGSADCGAAFTASILVFTEDASSAKCDEIAGIISEVLHDTQFVSAGMNFGLWRTNLVPAIRRDTRTWRAEVLVSGRVNG